MQTDSGDDFYAKKKYIAFNFNGTCFGAQRIGYTS